MRFGLAVRDIVPPFPTPMWGYGKREDCFDGVNDPLTFTALALEEDGRRALMGAADICGFPDVGTQALQERLANIVGCPSDHVVLNASHTHGGPRAISTSMSYRNTNRDACERFQAFLFDRVAEAAAEAVARLQPGTLWFGEGKTRLPMNRRPDRDGQVPNAPNPGGPVDDRMQVLAVRDAAERLVAVGLRLSCHPVATGAQHLLTADYPGAWRAEFARAFGPGVTPFFLQGAGADARPAVVANGDKWRQLAYSELRALGRSILAESLAVLTSNRLQPLGRLALKGRIVPVVVPCARTYTRPEDLQKLLEGKEYWQREYAKECLRMLAEGETIPDRVTFRVQTLWLDRETAVIGLDAEPLCALGRVVESSVAPRRALFLGYTNGCVAYTPDRREMARGGYEAESFFFEPWTGALEPGMEDLFAAAVVKSPDA